MTRWLDAARRVSMPPGKTDLTDLTPAGLRSFAPLTTSAWVLSVKTVLPGAGIRGGVVKSPATGLPTDTQAYLAFLSANGPVSYGAAAVALGWGATRTWRAEAQLVAAGLVRHDGLGKASLVEAKQ